MTDWIPGAIRLYQSPMPIRAVATRIGKGFTTVRLALGRAGVLRNRRDAVLIAYRDYAMLPLHDTNGHDVNGRWSQVFPEFRAGHAPPSHARFSIRTAYADGNAWLWTFANRCAMQKDGAARGERSS